MSERRISESDLTQIRADAEHVDGLQALRNRYLVDEVRRLRGLIAWGGSPLAPAHVQAARVGNLDRIVDAISDDYRMARSFLAEAEAIREEQAR